MMAKKHERELRNINQVFPLPAAVNGLPQLLLIDARALPPLMSATQPLARHSTIGTLFSLPVELKCSGQLHRGADHQGAAARAVP